MSNVKQNIQGNGNYTVGQVGGKTKVVQNVKGNNNQTVGGAPGDVTL